MKTAGANFFPTLKARRDVLDLCFLFKCINNIYDLTYIVSKLTFYFPKRALRKHIYFKPSFYRINLRKYSYLPRVCDIFNSMLYDIYDVDVFLVIFLVFSYVCFSVCLIFVCLFFVFMTVP